MAIISRGAVVKAADVTLWKGTPATWPTSLELSGKWASYAELYREQLWVSTVISKRALATARLPLKVFERGEDGRPEAREHPYARLIARPNERHSKFFFWEWTSSTFDTYGEVFWGKIRDPGGRPVQIVPLHPVNMHVVEEQDAGFVWRFESSKLRIDRIDPSDVVHIKSYNPSQTTRGMSKLEPLRRTLENEDAARRASSAFWKNGGRPSVVLTHPNRLSREAGERLKADWDRIHGGVDNFGKAAILEEGMKPETMQLSAEEMQYTESRRLNREEVCAAYDMPPPAVHILDRATFSNITENLRSLYRDTMAPHLARFESDLETQLRGSHNRGADEPDFGDAVYAEFVMDEVLRGDFEKRAEAYQQAINSGHMTPAEVRAKENLPFIPGSDRLLINGTLVPLSTGDPEEDAGPDIGELSIAASRLGLAASYGVIEEDEARELLGLSRDTVRTVMGRLSRQKDLSEVDADWLVDGLGEEAAPVRAVLRHAKEAGDDVAALRERFKTHMGDR